MRPNKDLVRVLRPNVSGMRTNPPSPRAKRPNQCPPPARHGCAGWGGGLNPTSMSQTIAPLPEVAHQAAIFPDGLALDCGAVVAPLTVAYRTYGTLNAAGSNALLICHALTGDQYVAENHPITGKPGWWETMVGPGKPLDTSRPAHTGHLRPAKHFRKPVIAPPTQNRSLCAKRCGDKFKCRMAIIIQPTNQ